MSTFTKAPWRVSYKYSVWAGEKTPIAQLLSHETTDEETTANAHLIAAAPDMYEALEFVRGFIEDYFVGDEDSGEPQEALRVVNKALKKARGE